MSGSADRPAKWIWLATIGLAVAMLTFATTAYAVTLLFEENFVYPPGTTLNGTGGWAAHSGAGTNPPTIATPGLSYPGYGSSGIGGMVGMAANGEDVNHLFANRNSGSVFVACLVDVQSTQVGGDYFFHLIDPANMTSFYFGRVFAQKDGASTNFAFGLRFAATGSVAYTSFAYAPGTTHLLVLKYTFVPGANNDQVALFVDPVIGAAEPAPTLSWTNSTTADATDLGAVALRQGAAASASTQRVDGIRVGASWADVVSSCPVITLSNLSGGQVGLPYSAAISPSGGTAPFSFALLSGTLPDGLSLASNGVLSGTPATASTNNFTVQATDAIGCTADRAYSMVINPAGIPTTTSLASSPNPSTTGTPVLLTATVDASAATGSVDFYDGATPIGTGTLSGGSPNTATMTTSSLSADVHALRAVYPGDGTYGGSTSAVTTQVVGPSSASTYTWNGTSTDWMVATAWTPPRVLPATGDEVRFALNANVTNVPTQAIGRLLLSGGATVTLRASAADNVLSLTQIPGVAFDVPTGCSLHNTTPNLQLALGSGVLASVGGTWTIGAPSTNAGDLSVSGTIQNGSGLTNSGSLQVGGTLANGNRFTNTGSLHVDGTFVMNANGYVEAQSPTYGPGSLLQYATGFGYNRYMEWTGTSGAGYPANVRVSNNTQFDLSNGAPGTARACSGGLTIDAGCTFTMNGGTGPMTAPLTVNGDVTIGGVMQLSSVVGGDLVVGGNWARVGGGAFIPNQRTVTFAGGADQTLSAAGGESFPRLIVDKPGGRLVLASPVTVVGTSGDVLTLSAGDLDLGGQVLSLAGSGGTLRAVGGTRSIVSSSTPGSIVFGGGTQLLTTDTTPAGASRAPEPEALVPGGTLEEIVALDGRRLKLTEVRWPATAPPPARLDGAGGFDFGATVTLHVNAPVTFPTPAVAVVRGTIRLAAGGSIVHAPAYADGATLVYDQPSGYTVGDEWSGTGLVVGTGVPRNITVRVGGGVLVMPALQRAVPGDLRLESGTLRLGSSLYSRATAYLAPATRLDLNNQRFVFMGTLLTNDGEIWGPHAAQPNASIQFSNSTASILYAGNGNAGTAAEPIARVVLNSTAQSVSIDALAGIHAVSATLFRGTVLHANRLSLGADGAPPFIQIGNAIPSTFVGGSVDATPAYNLTAGELGIFYGYESVSRATGPELPTPRSLRYLDASNPNGVAIAGGPVSAMWTDIWDGPLSIGAGNTLTVKPGGQIGLVLGPAPGVGLASGADGGAVLFQGGGTATDIGFNDVALAGGAVDFGSGCTVGGTMTLMGGSVGAAHPPVYATGSLLRYAVGMPLGDEWGLGTAGAGVPWNVEVASGTVDFSPAAASMPRTARGGVAIDAAATLRLGSAPGGDLSVGGDWTCQGGFLALGRTVTFAGSTLQHVTPGGAHFADVAITNPLGLTLLGLMPVEGVLTLGGGSVMTGPNRVVIGPAGSVAHTSGDIVGSLEKPIAAGSNVAQRFEVGHPGGPMHVALAFDHVSSPGSLVVTSQGAEHPDLGSSLLDGTQSVNRHWSISNSGVGFDQCSAEFSFGTGDLDPGADPARFVVGKREGSTWGYPAIGTRTASSTQVTGLTAFSDFALAEPLVSTFQPGPASGCITPAHACVTVPMLIQRTDPTPIRGYSVTFVLSANLRLCPTSTGVAEGTYLRSVNPVTSFQVVHNLDGSYTVDGAILGSPCGASAPAGEVFTLELAATAGSGVGSITVLGSELRLRDCDNSPLFAEAGPAGTVTIDPSPVTIAGIPSPQTVAETATLSVTPSVTLSSCAAGPVTWSATGLPSGAAIDPGTGSITWTPDCLAAQVGGGDYGPVTVSATAASGDAGAQSFIIHVTNTLGTVNVSVASSFTVEEQSALAMAAPVASLAGCARTPVTWSVTPALPGGATLDPGTGVVSWTPACGTAGTYGPFALAATAVEGETGSGSFSLVVSHKAGTVVVTPIPDPTVAELALLTVTPSATLGSCAAGPLMWSASGLPAGAAIEPTSGEITWTPPCSAFEGGPSYGPVSVSATAATGESGSTSFNITVTNTPVAVAAPTGLTAMRVPSGNGDSGLCGIQVGLLPPGGASAIEVYRRAFGNYPEYDDAPGAGSEPAPPSGYPPMGWTLTGVTASGGVDHPPVRDFWYYVAYARNSCGDVSPVSGMSGGVLDYKLGDVVDPGDGGKPGDNLVSTADLSRLGAHYGLRGVDVLPYHYLDVGPTTDYTVNARPTTDNVIGFEDLMMFSINFETPQGPRVTAVPVAPAAKDELALEAVGAVEAGQLVRASLWLAGTGAVRGLSARLAWDPERVTPVDCAAGELTRAADGVVLSGEPGRVDIAAMGTGTGLTGEGVIAVVTFRALASGDPAIHLGDVDARDGQNRKLQLTTSERAPMPTIPKTTQLARAMPNPFRHAVSLPFSLSQRAAVELAIFSVDGRRVRTLVHATREPGEYSVSWDGHDDSGQSMPAGVYFARLKTPHKSCTRTISYLR